MAQELDDDIVDVQAPEQDDDDIVEVQAPPSLLEKAFMKATSALTPSPETIETVGDIAQAGQDFSIGAAKGATMGALDEIGGLIGAGVESGLGMLGIGPAAVDAELAAQGFTGDVDESFGDKYRGYQQASEQAVKAAEERSPVISTLGQIGGGITSGMGISALTGIGQAAKGAKSISDIARDSGKAKAALELLTRGGKAYAQSAPLIAAESALSSEAQLIGEGAQPEKVAADVAGGLAFGLPAVLGLQAAADVAAPAATKAAGVVKGKIGEFVEDSPLLRQMGIAYQKYGKELKVNPKSEKAILEGVQQLEGGTPFSLLDTKRSEGIVKKVLKADEELGKLVGQSIDASKDIRVDASDITDSIFKDIVQAAQDMPSLTKDANFNSVITKVLSRNYKNASPRDIKNAIDDITNTIDRVDAYKYPTPEMEEAPRILRKLRAQLDQRLKDEVPRYREAAERFSDFRRAYMEQPIAGRFNPETDDIFYGNLKKGEKKLVDAYEDLVRSTTADSQATAGTEAKFSKLAQAITNLEKKQGLQLGDLSPDKLLKQIKDYADDAAVRRMTRKTQESQAGISATMKGITAVGDTGRGAALSGAYYAGRVMGSKPVQGTANIARKIYNAPAQTLSNLAARIENTPGVAPLGKALREGLESGDQNKRNAALFTIMQNPNARLLISAEDIEDEDLE